MIKKKLMKHKNRKLKLLKLNHYKYFTSFMEIEIKDFITIACFCMKQLILKYFYQIFVFLT